ncbi:MAG: hypothetical protein LUG65_04260 [Clostridiales bacterium]|nr:hypothetical protein [Clostridiales bacterium]
MLQAVQTAHRGKRNRTMIVFFSGKLAGKHKKAPAVKQALFRRENDAVPSGYGFPQKRRKAAY